MKNNRRNRLITGFLKFMGIFGTLYHGVIEFYALVYAIVLYSGIAVFYWNWRVGLIYAAVIYYLRFVMNANVVECVRCNDVMPSYLCIRVAEGPNLPPVHGPYCGPCFDHIQEGLERTDPNSYRSIH